MEFSSLAVMFFLVSHIPAAHAQAKPKLRVNPQSSIYIGDTITLICELQEKAVPAFFYYNVDKLQLPLNHKQANSFNVTGNNVGETVYLCCLSKEQHCSKHSEPVKITLKGGRPEAVLNVSPHSWLIEGDSVTLSCEVTDSSTDWTFSWYTVVSYRDGVTAIQINHGYIVYVELLSDSSRGSGGSYTLSPSSRHHTGVYVCRGEKREPAIHTQYSNHQPLWFSGESPSVSLIINPSRTQHFSHHSLSLGCEDQSIYSTGWKFKRYTPTMRVLDCSQSGTVTGSTCYIRFITSSYTVVHWCESESGEKSNPVNITVHNGDVILKSPVHPVTEGHHLTLRCIFNKKPSHLQVDFYKDGTVVQNQTTGEMIIYKVSKSDEGFYHCKHPERGESPKSWVSVRASRHDAHVEAPFSVLMLISRVVTASPYLLVTIILLFKCYRARAHTDEDRIDNAVIEE